MSIIAPKQDESKKELVPQANHVARCVQMIQIGTIHSVDKMGKPKVQHRVLLGWEIPDELRTFNEEKGPQPMMISNEYTLSMFGSAHLRQAIDSWRGQPLTDKEAEAFDITVLLGQPCMLNVVHNPSTTGTVYANVKTIAPLPKSVTCPPQINPSFELSFDKWDEQKFGALPEWIRKKIASSDEYDFLINGKTEPEPNKKAEPPVTQETFDDTVSDLPF